MGSGTDRSATTSYSSNFTISANTYGTINSAQILTDVQNFYSGTWSNYGWVIDGASSYGPVMFFSKEHADTAKRPYLYIQYTVNEASSGKFFQLF